MYLYEMDAEDPSFVFFKSIIFLRPAARGKKLLVVPLVGKPDKQHPTHTTPLAVDMS